VSRLIQNSTPAERFIGCSLALKPTNPAHIVANGGSITGSPTYDRDGVILDGTNDYLTYAMVGNEFNSAEISIVFEFWPDFNYDEDAYRTLFDGTNPYRYLCYKLKNTDSNTLAIYLGSTLIAAVAEGTYSPYWKVGERNVLVISGTSGDTSAWLNGNVLFANDATVWTAKNPPNFYVGAAFSGGQKFDGKIGDVKIFHSLLDAQDALNFYQHDNYTYMNDAILHLPMRASEHDPTNLRTLDVSSNGQFGSGNENYAEFGDGVTPTKYPTKLQKRGYSFDGGDYLRTGTVTVPNTTKCTFACVIKNPSLTGVYYFLSLANNGNVDVFGLIIIVNGQLRFYSGDAVNHAVYAISDSGIHTVIGVNDGTNTKIYVDGLPGTDAGVHLSPDLTGTQYATVGVSAGIGNFYTGEMLDSLILPIWPNSSSSSRSPHPNAQAGKRCLI